MKSSKENETKLLDLYNHQLQFEKKIDEMLYVEIKKLKRKQNNAQAALDKLKKKAFQEMDIITIFALLGFTVECYQAKVKTQNIQFFHIERIFYKNRMIFDGKTPIEQLCKLIEGNDLKVDKKIILVNAQMQLMVCALEELGFEAELKQIERSVKHKLQFPILQRLTYEMKNEFGTSTAMNVREDDFISIGEDLYEKVFKQKMTRRRFKFSARDFTSIPRSCDFISYSTSSFLNGIDKIRFQQQDKIASAVEEIKTRIWNI